MNYQHILVAIDYSAHCKIVLDKARLLAEQYNASLSVIHIIDNLPLSGTAYGTEIDMNTATDNALLANEKRLFAQELAKIKGCDIKSCLVWGVPKQEIIEYAEREKVDLIILGSHGRHGLSMLLGSTANAVLHHARCDVLAVRLDED